MSCRENLNAFFVFSNFLRPPKIAVYELMWKSIVEPGGPNMTI